MTPTVLPSNWTPDDDLVARQANEHPHAIAVSYLEDDWTYRQLHREVSELTDAMHRHGVMAGHFVGMNAEPSLESIVRFWAIQRLAGTAVLFSRKWPERYRARAALNVPLDWMFRDEKLPEATRSSRDPATSAHDSLPVTDAGERAVFPRSTVLFSSGSTGPPKPIVHHQAAHVASAYGAHCNLAFGPGDRWLWSLPWFHVSGLSILYRAALTGATVLIPAQTCPLENVVSDAAPTHLSLVPTQLKRLLESRPTCPKSLRGVLLGGAPIPREMLLEAVTREWPLHTTYGLTEMASQVTTTRVGAGSDELQTAGYPLPGREVTINKQGHLLVRGETLCLGYLSRGQLVPAVNDAGWYDTRDLGHWDACGRLIVTGRADHLFISGGENIFPEEIERALLDLPGVHQACVVAVQDDEYGFRPVAFIDASSVPERGWKDALQNRLPAYKIPDAFLPWPEESGLKPDRLRFQRLAQLRRRSS